MLLLRFLTALALMSQVTRPSVEWTGDSLDVVKENIAAKKAVFVDVRSVEEWKKGYVEGALFVPIDSLRKYSLNAEKLAKTLPKKEDKMILYTYGVIANAAVQPFVAKPVGNLADCLQLRVDRKLAMVGF